MIGTGSITDPSSFPHQERYTMEQLNDAYTKLGLEDQSVSDEVLSKRCVELTFICYKEKREV